ncbi:hypothetical protein C8R44DRAFT_730130 [Mycena epipterygia]|nr:hypothetical protein C8R44DRAFT_730130 [Mycena epipterygia]
MFSSFTSSGLLLAVLSSLAAVHALCLPCQVGQARLSFTAPSLALRRGVYSPPIITPHGSTKWVRGTEVNVTWSTSDIPKSITNPKGRILLGRLEAGSSSENLDIGKFPRFVHERFLSWSPYSDHPLAAGFDIRDGRCTVSVPDVPPRDNYIIVLMGDSGNRSPEFMIE